MFDPRLIRNFSIVAHIAHGKSTLADRIPVATAAGPSRNQFPIREVEDMTETAGLDGWFFVAKERRSVAAGGAVRRGSRPARNPRIHDPVLFARPGEAEAALKAWPGPLGPWYDESIGTDSPA